MIQDDDSRELRGVMIQVAGGYLLLPNATIAEVMNFPVSEAVPNAPAWMTGRIRWHGWDVPVVSFSSLAELGGETTDSKRVLVAKALGGNPRMPYFAIPILGFPRLVTIDPAQLEELDQEQLQPRTAVATEVRYNGQHALIPDLDALEMLIHQALAA